MRVSRKPMLIAALSLTLSMLSDGSQARTRQCVPVEILNYCRQAMCPAGGSFCVRRCIWNITAGDCWSRPKLLQFHPPGLYT